MSKQSRQKREENIGFRVGGKIKLKATSTAPTPPNKLNIESEALLSEIRFDLAPN